MAVTIKTGKVPDIGTPVGLFDTGIPYGGNNSRRYYDVTADGRRFLIDSPASATNSAPITVVLNWASALRKNAN